MLDVDGCLILSSQPAGSDGRVLPGAVQAVRDLQALGCRTLVFTNASSRPPEQIAASLAELNFPIGPDDVVTPSVVGAHVVRERYGDDPVLVYGGSGVVDVLRDAGANVLESHEPDAARRAAVVLVGWDVSFDQPKLQVAAEALWRGVPLLVTSDAPYFATAGGRSAGLSGFIANGLSYVTGQPYEVLGKPSSAAVDVVAQRLGVPGSQTLVVGDDLTLEVAMANAAGAVGVLVTTGTHTRDDIASLGAECRPDFVVDSISEVVDRLRVARAGAAAR
jgi:HAD superfamily hydrolase (TIGR01450 family)